MAAVSIAVVWLGGAYSRVLAALVAGAIFYEWTAMQNHPATLEHRVVAGTSLAATLVCLLAGLGAIPLFAVLAAGIAATGAHAVWRGEKLWETAGLAYAALSGVTLALIRADHYPGLVAILYLFAVVWPTDIFAYFAGRSLGGPKLAPRISPAKTWSGAIGGTLGGVLAGAMLAYLTGWGGWWAIVVALLLSVVSQLGDLLESFVKRRQGVKDSSHLIPGHGGVMDRVDGLVAAGWALYLIGAIFGDANNPASGLIGG